MMMQGSTRLRILIYGLNYAPELTGIGKYTGELAEWLAERGHEVRVVAAPPYYPAWQVREDYQGRPYRVERSSGKPTVFRAPLWVPQKPSGLTRLLHLASFMLGSIPAIARQVFWRPQLVFTVEPTFFCAPLAILIARLCGAKTWLHVQDFEVDAAFELGMLPAEGEIHNFAMSLERLILGAFDRVSTVSPKMLERFVTKSVPKRQTSLFPNWVDLAQVYHLPRPSSYRESLGLGDKIVLLYSGNMGAKQGLEILVSVAARFLEESRLHFVLCGEGAFRETLAALVKGMPNVTMLPLQPFDSLNELLNLADIHLLPQKASAADLVMPSKLTGILASGRPTIATAEQGTQVEEIVQSCGLVVAPNDVAEFGNAVLLLANDDVLRGKLGRAAREFAETNIGKQQELQRFERDAEILVSSCRSRLA